MKVFKLFVTLVLAWTYARAGPPKQVFRAPMGGGKGRLTSAPTTMKNMQPLS